MVALANGPAQRKNKPGTDRVLPLDKIFLLPLPAWTALESGHSAAERQAAYRLRRDAKRLAAEAEQERLDLITAITSKHPPAEYHWNRGCFMEGAPHGKGLLLSGGIAEAALIDLDEIEQCRHEGTGGGRRVIPNGHGPVYGEDLDLPEEREDEFHRKPFPGFLNLSPAEADVIRCFIADHIVLTPDAPTYTCRSCKRRFHGWLATAKHVEEQHKRDLRKTLNEFRNKREITNPGST